MPGELGGSWTSGKGGGLGSRGELAGEAFLIFAEAMNVSDQA